MDDATILSLDLPDDPALLKQLLIQERAQRAQIQREAAERIEAMQQKHKAEIGALLRRFYGPHSERFDPRQLLLFGLRIDSMPVNTAAVEAEAGQKLTTRRPRHKHGRQKLPECLERIKIEHDLTAEQKKCPCCGEERHRIGSEITEQLEHFPANFKVLQHIQYKYACGHCEHEGHNPNIELAAKPAQPIEKGLAGPGLLAYVITSKLADHLPLYRLEKIFARHDLHIASSTMCAWIEASAKLVQPLVDLMTRRVRQSKVIHTDETRQPVQALNQCRSGRIWAYIGDVHHPYIVYDYTPDRTRAGPTRWLEKYKGYLQADAYGGYDGIYHKGDVIEVACWAHGRRKFFDARETDGRRSAEMLAMVGQLYDIERQAQERAQAGKTTPPEALYAARLELRQSLAVPVLAKIKAWMETEQALVLPRSPIAAAIGYMLNQWDALCVYTTAGFLNIDNNPAERAMKRVALQRKNALFAGTDEFGRHHAVLWSLTASAEAHGIDPQRYLTSVLAKIATTPISELEQFLPEVWKREDHAEDKVINASPDVLPRASTLVRH
jgi:transposase